MRVLTSSKFDEGGGSGEGSERANGIGEGNTGGGGRAQMFRAGNVAGGQWMGGEGACCCCGAREGGVERWGSAEVGVPRWCLVGSNGMGRGGLWWR